MFEHLSLSLIIICFYCFIVFPAFPGREGGIISQMMSVAELSPVSFFSAVLYISVFKVLQKCWPWHALIREELLFLFLVRVPWYSLAPAQLSSLLNCFMLIQESLHAVTCYLRVPVILYFITFRYNIIYIFIFQIRGFETAYCIDSMGHTNGGFVELGPCHRMGGNQVS